MDVKLYLALAGTLGVAYVTYNFLNKPRTVIIPKDLTRRISQQIKHQMMIVCISYSKAMRKIRADNSEKLKGKAEQIFMQFRSELSQVYVSKENLILKKYAVSRQTYGKSLERWKHDKPILKNTEEIINMMERAISGQTPDFTIPQQVHQQFTKDDLALIYRDMVTVIGKKVTHKLQQQVAKNKNFNPNSDQDFRNAIRELAIYDVKVNFLKERGFKEEWGCPNEVFFKYLESEKVKDEVYEKKIVAYEKCYEKIIELVSVDPSKINDREIEQMFEKALEQQTASAKTTAPAVVQQPVRVAPVEAPRSFAPSTKVTKKSEPVDEEAELEAMMMQELLSRSQEPIRSVSVNSSMGESIKLGMTSSEIQNDWEKNGNLNENPVTKLEEATEEVAIGQQDESLIKKEMRVVQEALKEQQNDENNQQEQAPVVEEPVAEQPLIEEVPEIEAPAVILEVEPVVVQEQTTIVIVEQVVIEQPLIEEIKEESANLEESKPEEQAQQKAAQEQTEQTEEQTEEQQPAEQHTEEA